MLGTDVPLLVVSRQLGNASPQITATIYAHLSSDEQFDAVARAFQVNANSGGASPLGDDAFDEAPARR